MNYSANKERRVFGICQGWQQEWCRMLKLELASNVTLFYDKLEKISLLTTVKPHINVEPSLITQNTRRKADLTCGN